MSLDRPDRVPPERPTKPAFASSRRAFLGSAGAGISALLLTGAPPAAAASPRFVTDAFDGLAAFILPGNDAFSRQQKKTFPGPGAVANLGGTVVRETLDQYVPIQIAETALPAPGALGYALIMQTVALGVDPLSFIGPFAHPFANLTWQRKLGALQQIEELPGLNGSVIGYSANALPTIAGLGAYSERSAFDRRTEELTGRPVAWDYSNYGGRSDGWPEFKGFLDGVTEVPNS